MIVFNFTGLVRTYWRPKVERKTDHEGLWFVSARWLQVEVVIYSVAMATRFINRLNRKAAPPLEPDDWVDCDNLD